MKTSEIKFTVTVDENHVPEKIIWEASDTGEEGAKECKSAMISLWDKKEQNTLRIDLWTKEMKVDEMKHFFYQSMLTMSDVYERATSDSELAEEMREFGKNMGEKIVNRN